MRSFSKTILSAFFVFLVTAIYGQKTKEDIQINKNIKSTLMMHKELVSIPNLPKNKGLMLENINWVARQYDDLDFKTSLLETNTLPILIAEKIVDPEYKLSLIHI